MNIQGYFTLALSAILIENFILVRFLGICPFLGVSKKMNTAVGMGFAVIFVMGLSSAVTWAAYHLVLVPLEPVAGVSLSYLRTVVFILVIAVLVQIVEMFLQKAVPSLYEALGIYLPLITTNCAVLGAATININENYDFLPSVVFGVSAAIGFMLAIVLFASIRERLEFADYPKAFEGFPIALVTAGLMAIAFMGFQNLKVF